MNENKIVAAATDRLVGRAAEGRGPESPRSDAPGAIVIGGDYRGLGIVRSLGRQGIPVWVLTDQHRLAATSRYARHSLPWPETEEEQQVAFLLDLGSRYGLDGWLLYPTGDETAAMVARHHETLSTRFRPTVSPWGSMRWAYDKRLTHRFAEEHGVAIPWTRYPPDRQSVEKLECPFPVILKPALKKGFNPFMHDKAWRADDRETLVSRYDEACSFVSPDLVMVQEFVPGGGASQMAYAALCQDGCPLASIVVKRLRQYPAEFGRSSSYVETVEDQEVERESRRLLEAMRFTGLVEVEFKRDIRSGQLKLLDVNPRIWGWHSIGRRAGVDFPFLLWRLVTDRALPGEEARARPGIRWVRGFTDFLAVAQQIRSGKLSLRSYLQSLRGPLELAIFAPDDPIPAAAEMPMLVYLAWKRGAT